MACLICERSAEYELVRDGEAEAEVCKACTEEFLAVDEGNPTCVYCDRNGVYDVRTSSDVDDGGFPDAETVGDTFATPYESVLCEEHFAELGGEDPAGSPEAADAEDVEGDEVGDETTAEAQAEAEAEAEAETEATESESGEAEAADDDVDETGDNVDETDDDVDETGDAEIEAEQSPDGGDDATTKTDGNVTERDGS